MKKAVLALSILASIQEGGHPLKKREQSQDSAAGGFLVLCFEQRQDECKVWDLLISTDFIYA